MKKYIEYILEQNEGDTNFNLDQIFNNINSYIQDLKTKTKSLKMTGGQEQKESSVNSIKNFVDEIINNMDQIKKDGQLQILVTKCNTSIKKINFELSKLLKINDPDEQVKNDIEIHKGNLKLLTDLLNIALENKK